MGGHCPECGRSDDDPHVSDCGRKLGMHTYLIRLVGMLSGGGLEDGFEEFRIVARSQAEANRTSIRICEAVNRFGTDDDAEMTVFDVTKQKGS